MAYDPGAIDAALAAAVGDDAALAADLRRAFAEGARETVDQMARASDAARWVAAAWRLNGLAASFGATRMMALAAAAAIATPHDGDVLRQLERAVASLG